MNSSDTTEAQLQENNHRGGWITSLFLIGTMMCLTVGGGGSLTNLVKYLHEDMAKLSQIIDTSVRFLPIGAAIIADSIFGRHTTVCISALISILGTLILLQTSTIDSLRPGLCKTSIESCGPSFFQYAVVYTGLGLTTVGYGGTRFILYTMGADQFSTPKNREFYFNWYFNSSYLANFIISFIIVRAQEVISWPVGFRLCLLLNIVGLIIFMVGTKHYNIVRSDGSPFSGLARVISATIRKRKVLVASSASGYDFYHGDGVVSDAVPSNSLRFLNRGALIRNGDIGPGGRLLRQWSLCTVEQLEDMKRLIKLVPFFISNLLIRIPMHIQELLTLYQGVYMVHHFIFPVEAMGVFSLLSVPLFLVIFDKYLRPFWRKVIGRPPTPFLLITIGHVLIIFSFTIAIVVELKRRENSSLTTFWLLPQMIVVGVGEAFLTPGHMCLYDQEFPKSLRTLSSAMTGLFIGVSYYLGNDAISILRRVTNWWPVAIDAGEGKIHFVYWFLIKVGIVNFFYFLICATLCKYQPTIQEEEE